MYDYNSPSIMGRLKHFSPIGWAKLWGEGLPLLAPFGARPSFCATKSDKCPEREEKSTETLAIWATFLFFNVQHVE